MANEFRQGFSNDMIPTRYKIFLCKIAMVCTKGFKSFMS